MCFYRRRDLPNPLVQLADKHQREYSQSPSETALISCVTLKCVYLFCQQSEVMLPRVVVVVVAFKQVKS